MSAIWDVFVEGPSDKVFLQCLLKYLGISHVHTSVIGGGVPHLHKVKNEILRSHYTGNRIAIVLDADLNPKSRRVEFQKTRDKLRLPIDDSYCFLLPNDQEPGVLEILLERICVTEHQIVYDCFEEYERCLQKQNKSYLIPNRKAKVYAYCEALDIETNASKRDYCDPQHWDLNAPAIVPLKQFLATLR